MLRRWILHPFLLAIYPILALFAGNVNETRPSELVWPILLVVVGTAVVWGLFGLVLRDAQRAGLLATLAVFLFFTVAQVAEFSDSTALWLSEFWVRQKVHLNPRHVVVTEIVVILGLGVLVIKLVKKTRSFTAALNVFAIILVAMPTSAIATAKASRPSAPGRTVEAFEIAPDVGARPDIYYIVLDTYARPDVMKALFDYDVSPLIDGLERRGFYVARQSTANYCQTPLCLSSYLNAVYLDDWVRDLGGDQTELKRFIGQNRVVETLRPLGYKFVTFATGFEPTEHPEADVYLAAFHEFSEFHRMLVDVTPLGPLLHNLGRKDQFTMARERITYLLDHLADVAADPAPTFTLAHLLCPHPPFLFGENGEDVSSRDDRYFLTDGDKLNGTGTDPAIYQRGYRAQAVFITRRIERVIDRILAESPNPPIVILQSDHGSGWRLDMRSMDSTDLPERMSILNAYYFPGRRYDQLSDVISPVNSFRVVLNTFFGGRIELLPNLSYYSTWPLPYEFTDVTSKVEGRLYGEKEPAATVVAPWPIPGLGESLSGSSGAIRGGP